MSPTSCSRRSFLKNMAAAAAGASAWPLVAGGCAPGDQRPNVVFVLTDDHAYDWLGSAGHPWLETPALDRLAGDGVRFSNAFVTCSLCSPSRASFLSGLYPHAHGVCENEIRDLSATIPTFATLLQSEGYRTAFIGKWHMGRWARPRPGFDHWVGFGGQGDYRRNTLYNNGIWERSDDYITDVLTEHGVRFLRQQRRGRPFLLVLSHKAVHEPFEPAPRHAELYADRRITHRQPSGSRLDLKPDWGGRQQVGDLRTFLLAYGHTLAAVDESVARIQSELERTGQLDRTVFIYAGDNGYMMGEHGGLWDKRAAYERSIRIPLIVRHPGVFEPGTVCPHMALNVDIMPTLLDLAGLPPASPTHGVSLVDLVHGRRDRKAFLYEYFQEEGPVPTTLAVRTRRWKYITYPDSPHFPTELYDLQLDPDELINRAPEEGYSPILAELAETMAVLKEETGFRMCRPFAR